MKAFTVKDLIDILKEADEDLPVTVFNEATGATHEMEGIQIVADKVDINVCIKCVQSD